MTQSLINECINIALETKSIERPNELSSVHVELSLNCNQIFIITLNKERNTSRLSTKRVDRHLSPVSWASPGDKVSWKFSRVLGSSTLYSLHYYAWFCLCEIGSFPSIWFCYALLRCGGTGRSPLFFLACWSCLAPSCWVSPISSSLPSTVCLWQRRFVELLFKVLFFTHFIFGILLPSHFVTDLDLVYHFPHFAFIFIFIVMCVSLFSINAKFEVSSCWRKLTAFVCFR